MENRSHANGQVRQCKRCLATGSAVQQALEYWAIVNLPNTGKKATSGMAWRRPCWRLAFFSSSPLVCTDDNSLKMLKVQQIRGHLQVCSTNLSFGQSLFAIVPCLTPLVAQSVAGAIFSRTLGNLRYKRHEKHTHTSSHTQPSSALLEHMNC